MLYIVGNDHIDCLPRLLTLEVYKVLMMINFCIPRFGKYFKMFEILQ